MKKLLIFFGLFLAAHVTLAQKWPTVRIDSAVSVQLPKGYEKKDTTGEFNLVARSSFGTILIFKTPDNPRVIPDIERDRHLEQYYDEYVQKVGSSVAEGRVIDERDTLLGDLKVKDFTLVVDSGTGKQYRNFRIMHVSGASYTFEFLYEDIHEEYSRPERDKFFSSILISDELNRQDQYTTEAPPGMDPMMIGGIVLAILVLLLLFFWVRRRKRVHPG
jgi:hypothetical protein